jgi:23S rRNA C2498 (ribose-2'-O)-methylase RlmM
VTPTVREVLQGVAIALSTPPSIDAGRDYDASRSGLAATLAMLAAGEAEREVAATVAENAAIRALFGQAATHDTDGALAAAAAQTDADLTVPALDAVNARLRRQLIALHERIEAANDAGFERKIVALYVRMADGRRLALGGG